MKLYRVLEAINYCELWPRKWLGLLEIEDKRFQEQLLWRGIDLFEGDPLCLGFEWGKLQKCIMLLGNTFIQNSFEKPVFCSPCQGSILIWGEDKIKLFNPPLSFWWTTSAGKYQTVFGLEELGTQTCRIMLSYSGQCQNCSHRFISQGLSVVSIKIMETYFFVIVCGVRGLGVTRLGEAVTSHLIVTLPETVTVTGLGAGPHQAASRGGAASGRQGHISDPDLLLPFDETIRIKVDMWHTFPYLGPTSRKNPKIWPLTVSRILNVRPKFKNCTYFLPSIFTPFS